MTDDFSTQLRDRLHRAADELTLTGAGPDGAVARARTRQRTRRALAAGLGATLLVGAAVTSLDGGDDRASLATQTELPDAAPVELEWQRADDGVSNVQSSVVDTSSGATYALSTAPGLRPTDGQYSPPVDTLYRLGDDGRWEPVTVGDDAARPSRIAADGAVLYSIGTSAEGTGLATVVGTSTDGGRTWAEDVLGHTSPPNDTLPWRRIDRLGIAAAGGRQVAISTSAHYLDWTDVAGVELDDRSWIRSEIEADGVRLLREADVDGDRDVRSEEIGFRTWDDLDVTGPEVFEARTSVHLRDGDGWVAVDPAIGDAELLTLRAVGGRFVLRTFEVLSRASGEGVERTYTSSDGRAWTEVHAPGTGSVVPVGDGFAGHRSTDGSLVRSAGDGQWTDVPLGSIDERLDAGSVGMFAAGDLGLAFTVHGPDTGEPAHLVFTPDLRSWTVVPLADVLGEDGMWPSLVEVGADRIVVVGTDGGAGGDGPGGAPARSVTVVGVPRR